MPSAAVMRRRPAATVHQPVGCADRRRPAGSVSVKVSPVRGRRAGRVRDREGEHRVLPHPHRRRAERLRERGQRLHREASRSRPVVVTLAAWPRCSRRSCWRRRRPCCWSTSTVTVHEACAAFIVAPATVIDARAGRRRDNAGARDGHPAQSRWASPAYHHVGRQRVGEGDARLRRVARPVGEREDERRAPPWLIVREAPKAFVRDACVTVSVWFVTPLSIPPIAVICAAPFT